MKAYKLTRINAQQMNTRLGEVLKSELNQTVLIKVKKKKVHLCFRGIKPIAVLSHENLSQYASTFHSKTLVQVLLR